MEIPPELRRRPPVPTLDWAAAQIGPRARVTRVRRLRNAWAAAMHAIDVDDRGARHGLVLRRWARTDMHADIGVVENEAAALEVLAAASVPVPRLVGADPRGEHADVPALLMTRLPGRDTLAPADLGAYLDGLAAVLHAIHEVPVEPGHLNYFRPWGLDTVLAPPPWTCRPDVWVRAIEVANEPVPSHERVLVHRDFWPGNVLWARGRVSGVVDWTAACRGPAAADLAQCRENLALLFGLDIADDFARRYGTLPDQAWHDIASAVSGGSDGPPELWRWHDAGRTDITAERLVNSCDEFLAAALSRLA